MTGLARMDWTLASGLMPSLCEISPVCSMKSWFQEQSLGIPPATATASSLLPVRNASSITFHGRSDKCGQGRIDNRVADESFQPPRHRLFFQGRLIQTGLDTKTRARSNHADDRRGVLTFRKQFLCLKLTERAVETAIGFDHRSNLRQVIERTMHRTAVDSASSRFNRLKVTECVLRKTCQIGPNAGRFRCRSRGQFTGRHEELVRICRVVLKLTGPKGIGPGTEKSRGGIDRTQYQLLLFNQRLDGKLQQSDRFEERR